MQLTGDTQYHYQLINPLNPLQARGNYQRSQQHEVKFQDQVFTKFQDIFRSQEAQHIVNAYFFLNTNHS